MSKKKTVIEYRQYDLSPDFPVLLLTGSRWRISDKVSEHLHFHNCLEIGICHADSGTMIFEGVSMPFGAGDVTCVPRHVTHTTYSSPGKGSLWSYLFIDPCELFQDMFQDSASELDIPFSSPHNFCHIMSQADYPQIYFLATSVEREMKCRKANYQTCVKGLLMALCIELRRIQKQEQDAADLALTPSGRLMISPALDYIHQNYMQQFSIEELADLCHISVTHFRRMFHDIMGTSPLDFINSTRIEKACTLLKSTEKSILSISEQVGYHSISSFNRYFIKVMGISPRAYRNSRPASADGTTRQAILEYSGWK